MEFKGTKGKWEFQKALWHNTSYEHGLRLFVQNGSSQTTLLDINGSGKSKLEVLSNALLISKAPEMLEILFEIVEAIENETIIIQENIDNDGHESFGSKFFQEAKALIKSATEL